MSDWIETRIREIRESGAFIDDTHHYVMAWEKGCWTCAARLDDDARRYAYVAWCMEHNIAPYFDARKDAARFVILVGLILDVETAVAWRLRWT